MAKFKYCIDGSEPLIKDMKAVPATYTDGQVILPGAAEAGGCATAGAGTGTAILGVSNESVTLAGTQAAGTIENLKVIVNPNAVYAVEYEQGSELTWGTVTATTIPFTCTSAEGHPNFGGGWVWSDDTGMLDYVVSSATSSTTCTMTTVTGTTTTSDTGLLLYPSRTGQSYVLQLNAGATKIAADVDLATAGTNGITGVILETRLESMAYGSEILDPVVHNQQVRYPASVTTKRDKAKAFAYVKFTSALAI